MNINIKTAIIALTALSCCSCDMNLGQSTTEPSNPDPVDQSFSLTLENYVLDTKVSVDNAQNCKTVWTKDEYILVSNGTKDVIVSESGDLSSDGAEWINASDAVLSEDGKTLTFSTSLKAGSGWYLVATDNKSNISYVTADGAVVTNSISNCAGAPAYVGYGKAENGTSEVTVKNVMSYIGFSIKNPCHAVTIEAVGTEDADFCQSVCFDANYAASTGIGSSKVFSVLTSGENTKFYLPVTPVGNWKAGLVFKLWDEAGYANMSASQPLKSIETGSLAIALNKYVDFGVIEEYVAPATFNYSIPAQVGPINPAVFNCFGTGSRWFSIETTAAWTASVNTAETTASDVKLLTTSGVGDLAKFEVKVGQNTDFENRKKIVIDFAPEGIEPVKVVLEQEKASIMTFEFCNQDKSAAVWPFVEDPVLKGGGGTTQTYTLAGYTVTTYGADYNQLNESQLSLQLGKTGAYIELPAIDGRKLVGVQIFAKQEAAAAIQTEDGIDATTSGQKDVVIDGFTSFDIQTPYNNTSYRIVDVLTSAGEDKTFRLHAFTLEYAPATAADNPPVGGHVFQCKVPESPFLDSRVLSSLGTSSRWFSIETDVPWTASINQAETTAADATISATSGNGKLAKFEVTAGPNKDMENRKKVVIDFQPQGMEPVKFVMEQEKGSIISLEFASQDDATVLWPFVSPSSSSIASGTYTTAAGLNFVIAAPNGGQLNSSQRALQLTSGETCYVDTPAIEGYKLVSVKVIDRNGNTAPVIVTTTDGSVTGGTGVSLGKNTWAEWSLAGTSVNTSYRYKTTVTTKTVRLAYMVLEYSK